MSTLEIPGYSIRRTLGKGGMATVYLAEQEKFERDVALKVMAPALSADEGFRERFLREAKIVAKISHPHIVAVYDVNEVNGVYYIAMEFHPGGDLKARLKEGLGVRESLRIVKDVARALDFAHSKGYLHRDIKPDNILFRADGSAVLTDFGIAKATEGDANLTQLGMVAGTPKYMSPEQARGQALDADSDLYSLGIVLYEMLTGRLPFEASDPIALGILHMNAPIPRLEGRMAHFQPLIDRLLAKQPGQRPQSGAKLVEEIERLERGFDFDAGGDTPADHATALRPAVKRTPAGAPAPVTPAVPPVSAADADATVMTPSAAARPAVPSPAPVPQGLAPADAQARRSSAPRIVVAVGLVAVLASGGGFWAWQDAKARELSARVEAELKAAGAALARNALTSPAGDNALAHYRQVLALVPGQVEAKAGIQNVVAGLHARAYAALSAGRPEEAAELLAQASEIAPGYPGHPELEAAIADARAAAARRQALATLAAGADQAQRRPLLRAAADERRVATASAPDALARLRISGMLGSARQALEDGDTATAIQRYEQVLRLEPYNREASEGLRQARGR